MPTTTGCLTNAAEELILNRLLNGDSSWTLPTCYFALWAGNPTDTGAGSAEVTTPGTNGYARVAVGTGVGSKFAAAGSRAIVTNADIVWGPSTGGPWSAASHWTLMSASTGGTMLVYGDLDDASIGTDDSYKILSGQLNITFTAASKWTDAVLNAILDHLVGRTSWTTPDYYFGLYEGDPLGAGAETTTAGTNGYARVQASAKMGAASGGSMSNDTAIDYGPATGSNWGTVDYYSVHSAVTGGSVVGGAALTAPKTINVGTSGSFAIGALAFSLD